LAKGRKIYTTNTLLISRSHSYIKVIGSRSRSHEQKRDTRA